MPLTLVEKILAHRAGRDVVTAGERVRAFVDVVGIDEHSIARSWPNGIGDRTDAVPLPQRLVVFEEAFRPDQNAQWRHLDRGAREFARASGAQFVSAGRGGAQFVELADRGLVMPGDFVVSTARGARALGVLGALVVEATGVDVHALLGEPMLEIEVPRTVRVVLAGKPGRWCCGRDLGERVAAAVRDAIAGAVVQLEGEPYAELELPERLALADALADAGAAGIVCVPDERALAWIRARSPRLVRPLLPDPGATYAASVDVDVDGADPVVRFDASPRAFKPVSNMPTLPLEGVVLGGEHGGRIDDMRLAARLLKEHPIAAKLTLIVVPGSQRALQHAAEEGLLTVLLRAGVVLATPSAGLFGGPYGFVATAGDRWLYTSRPVAVPDGVAALLAGTAVAVASAVIGRVAHPDEVLRRQRETV